MSEMYKMYAKWASLIENLVNGKEIVYDAEYSLRPKRIPRKDKKRLKKVGLWPVYLERYRLNNCKILFDSINAQPTKSIVMDYYE